MGIVFIILGIVLIWVVLAEGGAVFHSRVPAVDTQSENPLELLNRRYARGEIDGADYEERRRALT